METNNITCPNCEKDFKEGFEFCPHCGQKAKDDLTIGVLFYNTISNYFSFDARFLKSFFPLLLRPGYLAKTFIGGKRLLYLHPAQLYLFISVIFFFMYSFKVREASRSIDKSMERFDTAVIDSITQRDPVQDSIVAAKMAEGLKSTQKFTGMNDEELEVLDSIVRIQNADGSTDQMSFDFNRREVDSMIQAEADDEAIYKKMGMDDNPGFLERKFFAQMLKFYKNKKGGSILQSFYDTIPIALFVLLPIFAFILKLFFFRKGPFSHHLVFAFYFFSFLFTVFSIILGVNYIWDVPDWVDWLLVLSTFFYLFVAVKHFYRQGWILSFIKSSMVTFLYLVFVAPLAGFILLGIAFMLY